MEGLEEVFLLELFVGNHPEELLILEWFDSKGDENKSTQQQGQGATLYMCNSCKSSKETRRRVLFLHPST